MQTSERPSPQGFPSRPRESLGSVLVAVALLMMFAACGNDDAVSTTTSSAPPATSTVTTRQPETGSTVAAPGNTVFGWLRSFEMRDTATVVLIDRAEMLTGDQALAAAREDGVIASDESLPNDFYLRNPDESTTEFSVSPDVTVTLQACHEAGECVTTEQVDLATWSVLLGGEDDPGLDWRWYGQGALPYVFTVADDLIVEIQEVYLP